MTTKGCINAFRKGLDKEYLKISAVYFVNSEKSDTFAIHNQKVYLQRSLSDLAKAHASLLKCKATRPQATETAHLPGWRNR